MIKCNVNLSAVISGHAVQRTGKDGKQYFVIPVFITIPSRNSEVQKFDIGVFYDKSFIDVNQFQPGSRIDITGVMTFKKRGETVYINLSADTLNLNTAAVADSLTGIMSFRGTIGKDVEVRNDKKGNPMLVFSAYSAELVNDEFTYLWVRFVGFGKQKEEWMTPKTKIEATGDLELSMFKDKLSLGCRLSEVKQYVKPNNEAYGEVQQQ